MDDKNRSRRDRGRYLPAGRSHAGSLGRWLCVTVLLIWDGLLLYMVAECLIVPVYGAAFIGVISICLGFKL